MAQVSLAKGAEARRRDAIENRAVLVAPVFPSKLQCAEDALKVDDAGNGCAGRLSSVDGLGSVSYDVSRMEYVEFHSLFDLTVEQNPAIVQSLGAAHERIAGDYQPQWVPHELRRSFFRRDTQSLRVSLERRLAVKLNHEAKRLVNLSGYQAPAGSAKLCVLTMSKPFFSSRRKSTAALV